jgi:prepilin-type N-terminal cleavage/methylation domain-containing protein
LKKFLNNQGFSLAEMTIATGLMGVLALIIYSVNQYTNKEIKIVTEDIQNLILKFGANKVLQRDLVNSTPSYNYLEFLDDNGKPFFVHATNEYCQTDCERKLSLTILTGQTLSSPIFFLVNKRKPSEQEVMLNYPIKIENTLNSSHQFDGLNANPDLPINKSVTPLSPWEKGRLLLLTSNVSYYDCLNTIHGNAGGGANNCLLTCANTPSGAGTCNYAAKRPLKILGIVQDDEKNMEFHFVNNQLNLLKKDYRLCPVNQDMQCAANMNIDLNETKKFIENLPFIPGFDNQAFLQPVELVRYHLERPTPNSKDDKIVLMRSVATLSGTKLSFERAHVLMSGVKSIVFTRKNISSATLEFKIDKVRLQTVIK